MKDKRIEKCATTKELIDWAAVFFIFILLLGTFFFIPKPHNCKTATIGSVIKIGDICEY